MCRFHFGDIDLVFTSLGRHTSATLFNTTEIVDETTMVKASLRSSSMTMTHFHGFMGQLLLASLGTLVVPTNTHRAVYNTDQ